MAKQDHPYIIIGGGIGGLACALALARKGFRSLLLEQAAEFGEIGAGIQLGPNVFRMFDKLGVTDKVRKLAVFPEYLMMRDTVTTDVVTRINLDETFLARFGNPYAVIHRADLHRALLDACAEYPDFITMKTSQKVTTMDDKGDRVVVSTETGEVYEGAAIVGADGLWSIVRQKIVGDGKPVVSGHITYRAVLPTSEVPEELRALAMILWAGEKTPRAGTAMAIPPNCTSVSPRPANPCAPCSARSRAGACGCSATVRPFATGAVATSPCSATPPIPCCNISRRARIWPSRTRCASPARSSCQTVTRRAPSSLISRSVICAPPACN